LPRVEGGGDALGAVSALLERVWRLVAAVPPPSAGRPARWPELADVKPAPRRELNRQ
jgi:hypothetical protein